MPARWRERASRLLAMAHKAREKGDADFAECATAQAIRLFDKAAALELAEARTTECMAVGEEKPQAETDPTQHSDS